MAKAARKKDLKQIEKIDGRAGNDTIRLWEGYRDQALMWRALALLQIPATTIAIFAALIMYFFADTVVNVPQKPLPGYYSAHNLPDDEFISVATEVVNLIASYQPETAHEQYENVRKYLWGDITERFKEKMIDEELPIISTTHRSQLFFIDTKQVRLDRMKASEVVIKLPGKIIKVIKDRPISTEPRTYIIKMTTIPRNELNPYGIVVTEIKTLKQQNEQNKR